MDCPRCGGPIPPEETDMCPYCFYLLSQANAEEAAAAVDNQAANPPAAANTDPGAYETVNVFGVKMKVKKKGWSELLNMDAKEALTGEWNLKKEKLSIPTAGQEEELPGFHNEQEYVLTIESLGQKIGFQQEGNFWVAAGGHRFFVKPVFGKVDLDLAGELVQRYIPQRLSMTDFGTTLLIGISKKDAGALTAAIKAKSMYHLMNAVSFNDLAQLASLKETGLLDNNDITGLLVPLAMLDTGHIIKLIFKTATRV